MGWVTTSRGLYDTPSNAGGNLRRQCRRRAPAFPAAGHREEVGEVMTTRRRRDRFPTCRGRLFLVAMVSENQCDFYEDQSSHRAGDRLAAQQQQWTGSRRWFFTSAMRSTPILKKSNSKRRVRKSGKVGGVSFSAMGRSPTGGLPATVIGSPSRDRRVGDVGAGRRDTRHSTGSSRTPPRNCFR